MDTLTILRGRYQIKEILGAKRYVFHAPAAAADLQVILGAMPKQWQKQSGV